MLSTMHRLAPAHLPGLIAAFDGASLSSYVTLASTHGYSVSELHVAFEEGSVVHFADDPAKPGLLLSVDTVDRDNGHARVQLCGGPAAAQLAPFLASLRRRLGVPRLCSYLFPEEEREAALLASLGFEPEARLREHVFVKGAYRDLVVYGWVEEQ